GVQVRILQLQGGQGKARRPGDASRPLHSFQASACAGAPAQQHPRRRAWTDRRLDRRRLFQVWRPGSGRPRTHRTHTLT
ncbi:hypothetical protein APUTEX25_003278, partial [Auxenochlorella protothecoides]